MACPRTENRIHLSFLIVLLHKESEDLVSATKPKHIYLSFEKFIRNHQLLQHFACVECFGKLPYICIRNIT